MNVITEIGFGEGELRYGGDFAPDLSFAFQYRLDQQIVILSNSQLMDGYLTFAWFKANFICKDQPWICEGEPLSQHRFLLQTQDSNLKNSHTFSKEEMDDLS